MMMMIKKYIFSSMMHTHQEHVTLLLVYVNDFENIKHVLSILYFLCIYSICGGQGPPRTAELMILVMLYLYI